MHTSQHPLERKSGPEGGGGRNLITTKAQFLLSQKHYIDSKVAALLSMLILPTYLMIWVLNLVSMTSVFGCGFYQTGWRGILRIPVSLC